MKNFNFAKYIALSVFTLLFFTACKKDYVDPLGDKGQKTIGFVTYGGKSAAASSASALVLDLNLVRDSLEMRLLYSTPQVHDKDITVTIFNDLTKVAAFNAAQPTGSIIYDPVSATQVTLKTPQVKIRAGQTLSEPFYVIFFSNQLDAAKSYLITLGISKIEGAPADVKPASGTGTAYVRIVGNPLAGNYASTGYFYHPSAPRAINIPSKTLAAASPTKLEMNLGDLGARVILSVDATNNVTIADLNGVNVGISPTLVLSSLPGVYSPMLPNPALYNNKYDPATRTFYLRYGYEGGSGPRTVEEKLVRL